jgi:uncharacterized membrane protein YgaE (UPF0421/DUF939 family)
MFLGNALVGMLIGFVCALIAHFGFGFGFWASVAVYSLTGSVGLVVTALLSVGCERAVDDFEEAKSR